MQPKLHNILNPVVGEFKKLDKDKNIKILLTAAPKKLVEQYIKIFKN